MRLAKLCSLVATAIAASVVGFVTFTHSAVACSYLDQFTMVVPADGETVGPSTKVGFAILTGNFDATFNTPLRLSNDNGESIELTDLTVEGKALNQPLTLVTATPTEPLAPGTYRLQMTAPPTYGGYAAADLDSTFTVTAAPEAGPPSTVGPGVQWDQVAFEKEGFTNNSCGPRRGMFFTLIEVTPPAGLEGRSHWYEVVVSLPNNETVREVLVGANSSEAPLVTTLWTSSVPTCVSVTGFNAHGETTPESKVCTPTATGTHQGGDVGLFDLASADIRWTEDSGAGCSGTTGTGKPWLVLMALLMLLGWVGFRRRVNGTPVIGS